MNPWKDTLGCEVTVCQAKHCDVIRMEDCALRKFYLERLSWLQGLLLEVRCQSKKREIQAMINHLTGVKEDGIND